MVAVEHGGDGRDFLGKQPEVELGVALLNHAAQGTGGADAAGGPVDGAAIPTHLLLVAGSAFALDDQPLAQLQVGAAELGRPLLGNFDEALKQSYLGMSEDVTQIRKNRAERRKKMMMEQKHG